MSSSLVWCHRHFACSWLNSDLCQCLRKISRCTYLIAVQSLYTYIHPVGWLASQYNCKVNICYHLTVIYFTVVQLFHTVTHKFGPSKAACDEIEIDLFPAPPFSPFFHFSKNPASDSISLTILLVRCTSFGSKWQKLSFREVDYRLIQRHYPLADY